MRRTATIRSTVDSPETIAAAIEPDNTAEMETTVDDEAIVTTIEREHTGGLRSTVDDYVVNLTVALEVAKTANRHTNDTDTTNS